MTAIPSLGNLLRQRRAALDLTQEAAAERVGCAVDTIRAYERGERRPSVPMAERLAVALQVPEAEREAFLAVARAQPAQRPPPDAPAAEPPGTALALKPLPLPASALMGREAELAQLVARLREPACRLLTLVGPGGVGKTRLALQAAHDLQQMGAFPEGVAWVNLTPASSPDDAVAALASALGIMPGADPGEQLAKVLAPRTLLLVLDNLEHVLPLAALIDRLLHRASGLRVLATSRERLRIPAEQLHELDGLAIAASTDAPIAPATLLFVERARQVAPGFRLNPQSQPAVEAICRELAGVPLAIELAAAWSHVLTPPEIAAEIQRGLDFLALDAPLVTPHQRSLREVFARSWALLTPWERAVCGRLALFRGGCTREAAAAIVAEAPDAPPGGLLLALGGLVQKSLVRRVADAQGLSRYELHELTRQYALEELGRDPAALDAARRLHAGYFLGLMERRAAALHQDAPIGGLHDLDPDVENLRLAWGWAVEAGDLGALGRGSAAIFLLWNLRDWFWDAITMLDHCVEQLRERLRRVGPSPALAHALGLVLNLQGYFYGRAHQFVQARAALRESSALLGDAQHLTAAGTLRVLALVEAHLGSFAEGRRLAERDLELMRAAGQPFQIGLSLLHLAIVAWLQGDYATARAACDEALATTPVRHEPRAYSMALETLTASAVAERRLDEAVGLCQQNFQLSAVAGHRQGKVMALLSLGRVALLRGERDEARYLVQEAVELGRQVNDRWVLGSWLAFYGQFAATHGDPDGARQALREATPIALADRCPPSFLAAATGLAALLAQRGEAAGALRLLALVQAHEAALPESRLLARQLREKLAGALDPAARAAAEAEARGTPGEAQIAAALRLVCG